MKTPISIENYSFAMRSLSKRIFPALSILLIHFGVWAQSSVQTTIQLLTPDLVGSVVIETDESLIKWMKSQSGSIQKVASDMKGNADIQVVYTLRSDGDPLVVIHSKPGLNKDQKQKFQEALDLKNGPRTRFSTYDFVIMAKVNQGMPEEMTFDPPLKYPFEISLETFEKQGLVEKKDLLRSYIREEVMPLLSNYTGKVDEQFLGVRWMNRFMASEAYITHSLDSVLYNKPEYWRAVMEMEAGNQLILFSAMCMHMVRNEFDRAERLNFLIGMFSNEGTLPDILSDQIQPRLTALNANLSAEIEKGLAFHDVQDFAKADSIYSYLLRPDNFPNSAWLNYEKYFTTAATLTSESADSLWYVSRRGIYACDPLYPMDIRARNGQEAYLMMRRQSIRNLFIDPDNYRKDFVNYADIALDLKVYGFAAQLYWIVLSHLSKDDYNDRNILSHYLLCLEKMGVNSIRDLFEGDFEGDFERIESERYKLMKESGIYQAFGR